MDLMVYQELREKLAIVAPLGSLENLATWGSKENRCHTINFDKICKFSLNPMVGARGCNWSPRFKRETRASGITWISRS